MLVFPRFIPTGVGNTSDRCDHSALTPVHPHGCGEHDHYSLSPASVVGSSPRVWGTPYRDMMNAARDRFIPTGVGNTSRMACLLRDTPVHPHGCGEHPARVSPAPRRTGSSPRVWGTRISTLPTSPSRRFIPTGVGNTDTANVYRSTRPVHPHGCGEHRKATGKQDGAYGSSPRVWGTPSDPSAANDD